MIVNSAEKDVAPSIAKKPVKKSSGDFAKFLHNLGKTDKPIKGMESKLAIQNKILSKNAQLNNNKALYQPKSLSRNNLIQKTSFEASQYPKPIKTSETASQPPIIKPESFSPLIDDTKEITSPKSKDELFKKILQNKPQSDTFVKIEDNKNDVKNPNELQNKDNIIRPKNSTLESPESLTIATNQENSQEINDTKDLQNIKPKLENVESKISQLPIKDQKISDVLDDTSTLEQDIAMPNKNQELKNVKTANNAKIPNETNDLHAESSISPASIVSKEVLNDALKTPKNDMKQTNDALIDNILKDSPSKFSTLSDDDVKLSLKDTLKYGAFKAFDALSLLKPSDGKKLSDLIKNADELALNLTKIQHKKEIIKPNEVDNKKPLELKNNDLKAKIESAKDDLKLSQQQENQTSNQQNINQENDVKNIAKNNNKTMDLKNADMQKENLDHKDNQQNQRKDAKDQTKTLQKQELAQTSNHQNTQNLDSKPLQKDASELNTKDLAQQDLAIEKNQDLKPANFKLDNKKELKLENDVKQANNDKNVDPTNVNNTKNDQMQRNADLKETFSGFARALKQEIVNYKPPLSKLTLELNPANLGNIEVSITHQGKNLQLQLNGNQNTINLFIQNQSDLRSALSQIGYENITMSFSNGSQMGFSDNSGKWNFRHLDRAIDSIDDTDNEMANLEITLVNNYA